MNKGRLVRFTLCALMVTVIGTLTQGTPRTFADSVSISPATPIYWDVPGMYSNSYAKLTSTIAANATSIAITDAGCLRATWYVEVDSEVMLINSLTPGTNGNPDTMQVSRGQNGTTATTHSANAVILSKAISVDIMAQNVSAAPYGLGAFEVQITLPAGVQFIEFTSDSQWLGSTGRVPNCLSAYQQSTGVWNVQCASLDNPHPGDPLWYPPGPNGSGRIARLTILPPAVNSTLAIPLTGSYLLDVRGGDNNLNAALQSVVINAVPCPDANLDGRVNVTDLLYVALTMNDTGQDSGATILNDINGTDTQTTVAISDQSKLSSVAPNNVIAIDDESMRVTGLTDGSPDTMTVTRGVNYPLTAAHKAGAHIYLAKTDGNHDGKYGYTPTRDVLRDGAINVGDLYRVAIVMQAIGAQVCPAP